MSGGGSSEPAQRTVVQQATIPGFLRPLIEQSADVSSEALSDLTALLLDAGAGDLVAGFTPAQLRAFGSAEDAIGEGGVIPEVQENLLSTARGDFLYGGPGFDAAVDAAVRAAQPHILSRFGRAGAGTSGLAQAALGKAAIDAFAGQYGTERGRQLQALGMLPDLALLPSDVLGRIGGQQQAQEQRELTAPITAAESLLSTAQTGLPVASLLGQTQTGTSSQETFRNPVAGALGGGLTGAKLGSLFGPWGTAIGAVGGGLLGGFG